MRKSATDPLQDVTFSYDANKNLGLVGVFLSQFYGSDRSGPGRITLTDSAVIIPQSLLNKAALVIPYQDIFQLQNRYHHTEHKIIIKHDGGRAQIVKNGLGLGDYDKLLHELQSRVKAAGGGGLGLY